MDTPWSELPNARHIDWILESLRTHSEVWDQLWESWDAAWGAAWNTARQSVPLPMERASIWGMARAAARDAARDAARPSPARSSAARGAIIALIAYDAIIALIAYDDCDQYLNMTYEQLLIYATLSEKPQAVLLLPLKWIQEHLSESLAITDNT